jgi:L-alanine-DL-glutamate epimerase-like enolase superfamily enzyme
MGIADLRAYTLSAPLEKPWKIAGLVMAEMTATIVEVETDHGLIGYGEALTRLGPAAAREVVTSICAREQVKAIPQKSQEGF